jgi:two-component system, LytTR family, sensor kinase
MKKTINFKLIIISSLIITALTSANRVISLNYREWYEVYILFFTNLLLAVTTWICILTSDEVLLTINKNTKLVWRIVMSSIVALLVLFLVLLLLFNFSNLYNIYFSGKGFSNSKLIPVSIFRAIILVTAIQTVKQMFDVLAEKQRVLLENEILKREKLSAQFQSLKQQVNPHFLFNSLNTLKSLIKTNDVNAEEFVIRLSEIYRYILQKDQNDLVTIHEELEILQAYIFMLKARFEDSINVIIQINNEILDKVMLPPFTLQLLIENSIKHNIASLSKPLQIEVYNNGYSRLIVKNKMQPKINIDVSTGIGLENINKRCTYLCGQGIDIVKTETEFIVEIPLIRINENSNC